MTRIVLVRHGATAWTGRRYCGRSDPELSSAGLEQARTAAIEVAGLVAPGTSVVASPSRRALDTARLVADRIGGPIAIDDRLSEVDFGAAEGLSFESVSRRWPAIAERLLAADVDIDWPDGESATAFRTRLSGVAETLASTSGDLVVVSHAGPIAALAALLANGLQPPVLDLAPGTIVVVPRRAQAVE
jgi:ribonuclease H / adenosylcobalamin/alpha-ribazole phosphatase